MVLGDAWADGSLPCPGLNRSKVPLWGPAAIPLSSVRRVLRRPPPIPVGASVGEAGEADQRRTE